MPYPTRNKTKVLQEPNARIGWAMDGSRSEVDVYLGLVLEIPKWRHHPHLTQLQHKDVTGKNKQNRVTQVAQLCFMTGDKTPGWKKRQQNTEPQ